MLYGLSGGYDDTNTSNVSVIVDFSTFRNATEDLKGTYLVGKIMWNDTSNSTWEFFYYYNKW